MIDKKKIGKAAKKYAKEKEKICKKIAEKYKSATSICNWVTVNPDAAFKDGIDWFLKNLWHPASEEPKRTNQENEFVECLVRFKDGIVCLYNYDTWHHWWCSDEDNQKFLGLIDKWLYIDDLLTKKKEVSND